MLKSEQQNIIDSQKKLINNLIKEKQELMDKLPIGTIYNQSYKSPCL